MASASRHETSYRVRFDEAGPNGLLRASGLLRYAQDIAWMHSEALGFDRAWYRERELAWLVRAAEVTVGSGIAMGAIAARRSATDVPSVALTNTVRYVGWVTWPVHKSSGTIMPPVRFEWA